MRIRTKIPALCATVFRRILTDGTYFFAVNFKKQLQHTFDFDRQVDVITKARFLPDKLGTFRVPTTYFSQPFRVSDRYGFRFLKPRFTWGEDYSAGKNHESTLDFHGSYAVFQARVRQGAGSFLKPPYM